ncbi:MAG: carboxypeptidase-like regulatory domain-containing protein, partial [Gammaproteobacteria bacterium]
MRTWLALAAISMMTAISFPAPVFAQVTSSEIRGQIVSDEGVPVSDATVLITHVPSGTASRATTGPGGQFFQS